MFYEKSLHGDVESSLITIVNTICFENYKGKFYLGNRFSFFKRFDIQIKRKYVIGIN